MTSQEFIGRARDYARRTGQRFRFDSKHGKGSHGESTSEAGSPRCHMGVEEGRIGRDAAPVGH